MCKYNCIVNFLEYQELCVHVHLTSYVAYCINLQYVVFCLTRPTK